MRIRSECWLNGLCSIVLNSLIVAVFHVSWGGESGLLVADEPGLTRCELIPLRHAETVHKAFAARPAFDVTNASQPHHQYTVKRNNR